VKIRHTAKIAVAIGLGLWVTTTPDLAAPSNRTVYLVIEVDEIMDAEGYKALLSRMGPSNVVEVKFADGRYLARTENITALGGTAPKGSVIIAFDNVARAKAYYDTTQEMIAMRTRVTKSRSFIVEGL